MPLGAPSFQQPTSIISVAGEESAGRSYSVSGCFSLARTSCMPDLTAQWLSEKGHHTLCPEKEAIRIQEWTGSPHPLAHWQEERLTDLRSILEVKLTGLQNKLDMEGEVAGDIKIKT